MKTKTRTIVIAILLMAGIAVIGSLFLSHGTETTDDAQVEQYISPINVKVPGYIREMRIALKQAEAALMDARSGRKVVAGTLNERQQHYIHRLVADTPTNRLPVGTTKLRITKQATLLAMKDITGKTIWLLLGTAELVMVLPYHKNETT